MLTFLAVLGIAIAAILAGAIGAILLLDYVIGPNDEAV